MIVKKAVSGGGPNRMGWDASLLSVNTLSCSIESIHVMTDDKCDSHMIDTCTRVLMYRFDCPSLICESIHE